MTTSSGSGSSSSITRNHDIELSSFYASFRADDTLIDIIPAFDYHNNNNNNNNSNYPNDDEAMTGSYNNNNNLFQTTASSTNIFGGSITSIKAGLTYTVPVWMAIVLQQRSFATIIYPIWFTSIPNLQSILQYEKTHASLFHTATTTTSSGDRTKRLHHDRITGDDDDDDHHRPNNNNNNDEEYYLPSNYYELAMRFKSLSSTSSSSSVSSVSNTATSGNHIRTSHNTTGSHTMDVALLLIQDIYDIRTDKLRQQFQTLLYETTKQLQPPAAAVSSSSLAAASNTTTKSTTTSTTNKTTDLIINVTGIATQELTAIQSFVLPAMNDIYYLEG